jgi:hypothetical protein
MNFPFWVENTHSGKRRQGKLRVTPTLHGLLKKPHLSVPSGLAAPKARCAPTVNIQQLEVRGLAGHTSDFVVRKTCQNRGFSASRPGLCASPLTGPRAGGGGVDHVGGESLRLTIICLAIFASIVLDFGADEKLMFEH